MICYIKDKKTFTTKSIGTAVDFELHESIYDTVSRVVIPTPKSPLNEGDFIMFDGDPFVGIISEVQTSSGRTEISVEQAVRMFSREMFYTAASYTYVEGHLKNLIDTNYTNCTDEIYEVPFLDVNALTSTNVNCKPDLDNNKYTIASYISKLRRLQDIVCDWDFNRTTLTLNIYKKLFPIYNIDLSNPRFNIVEQTFSDVSVGKVTVYCEENNAYTNWYLKADGSITQTYSTSDRVDGEWSAIVVGKIADIQDAVRDLFALNYYSHKVSFTTDKEFQLYDRLKLRIEGRIFDSYVSGIIKRKGSKYKEIECGELQTQYPFLQRL